MSYVTPEGIFSPSDHQPLVPTDGPEVFGADVSLPYFPLNDSRSMNIEMQTNQVDVKEPDSIWESIKGIPTTFIQAYVEQQGIPMANWNEPAGRGQQIMAVIQDPLEVPGKVGYFGRNDRFGPWRYDYSHVAADALDAYLASALPSEVRTLQAQTAR